MSSLSRWGSATNLGRHYLWYNWVTFRVKGATKSWSGLERRQSWGWAGNLSWGPGA